MPDARQKYYDAVADELTRGELIPGLWARAMAETGTDDARARAAYIRLRVVRVEEEELEGKRIAEMKREQELERQRAREEEEAERELARQRAREEEAERELARKLAMYLGHDFRQGRCQSCGAVETSVRQYRTRCLGSAAKT
jgi:hypothetical protein